MEPSIDVAIAGAGIGGAVLALTLARQGLRVVVAERASRFSPIYRGEFLQPRSLEILAALGLGEQIARVTTPVHQVRFRRPTGEVMSLVDYQALATGVPEGRNGHHREIQAAVLDALRREPTAEVRMGLRATGLLRGPGGRVAGLLTSDGPLPARLTVGADGQHSEVRKHLGLPAIEYRYPGEPLAVTVELGRPAPVTVDFVFGRGESALAFPLPEGRARLYLVVNDQRFAAMRDAPDGGLSYMKERLGALLPEFREAIARIPGMGAVQRVPCWYLRASQWVADGAAILGDAAHAVSPTRGQGMNLAIQDAATLGALVGAIPRGQAISARDLAPYEQARQRAADFIQRDAGRVHGQLLMQQPARVVARNIWLSTPKRAPRTMAAVLGMYAGTVRPPVWYDHLFVTAAVSMPFLDAWVARVWGRRLPRLPVPVSGD